jgi:hypothetical protein
LGLQSVGRARGKENRSIVETGTSEIETNERPRENKADATKEGRKGEDAKGRWRSKPRNEDEEEEEMEKKGRGESKKEGGASGYGYYDPQTITPSTVPIPDVWRWWGWWERWDRCGSCGSGSSIHPLGTPRSILPLAPIPPPSSSSTCGRCWKSVLIERGSAPRKGMGTVEWTCALAPSAGLSFERLAEEEVVADEDERGSPGRAKTVMGEVDMWEEGGASEGLWLLLRFGLEEDGWR